MRNIIGTIVALAVLGSIPASAQGAREQKWTGRISDSMCKEKHPAGEHEGKKMTDATCTDVCVKKGAKYVFVSEGKVYQLTNQSSKTIASHVGQDVLLVGELKGDTIAASRMTAAKPAK